MSSPKWCGRGKRARSELESSAANHCRAPGGQHPRRSCRPRAGGSRIVRQNSELHKARCPAPAVPLPWADTGWGFWGPGGGVRVDVEAGFLDLTRIFASKESLFAARPSPRCPGVAPFSTCRLWRVTPSFERAGFLDSLSYEPGPAIAATPAGQFHGTATTCSLPPAPVKAAPASSAAGPGRGLQIPPPPATVLPCRRIKCQPLDTHLARAAGDTDRSGFFFVLSGLAGHTR